MFEKPPLYCKVAESIFCPGQVGETSSTRLTGWNREVKRFNTNHDQSRGIVSHHNLHQSSRISECKCAGTEVKALDFCASYFAERLCKRRWRKISHCRGIPKKD